MATLALPRRTARLGSWGAQPSGVHPDPLARWHWQLPCSCQNHHAWGRGGSAWPLGPPLFLLHSIVWPAQVVTWIRLHFFLVHIPRLQVWLLYVRLCGKTRTGPSPVFGNWARSRCCFTVASRPPLGGPFRVHYLSRLSRLSLSSKSSQSGLLAL